MEKTGFYAGSFDPFTVRHLTIVKAAAASLKRIIIAVDAAPEKEMTFSAERRVQLVKSSLSDFVRIGQLFREMPNCDLFRNEADRRPLPENWTDCIEVVTFSGDPFKAAAAAGADVFIADPSENYAPSPENSYFLEQIGRYCGHSPQLFTVPADICEETFLYMSALQVKRLCRNNLFVLAARGVMPSVMDALATFYLQSVWLREKVWYSDQSNSRYYKLAQLYNDPRRCYHTMAHLAYMLDLLEVYEKREKTDFDRHHLILAVIAHDLVNEGTADDVARSAQKVDEFFGQLNRLKTVKKIVAATDHENAPNTPQSTEEKLIRDLDLAILGDDSFLYWQYVANLRQEYISFPLEEIAVMRIAFLQKLLAREHIFALPLFRRLFEENARKNINDEIAFWQRQTCGR